MVRFDDKWFYGYRSKLLLVPQYFAGNHSTRRMREVSFAKRGAATTPDEHRKHVEQALKKLAPRHAASVRSNMQFYRSCLESLAIVPPDPVVRSAVEIEWLWYSTPFKEFYRDHLAHVQKVTATAEFLISDKQSPLPKDKDSVPLNWIAQKLANRDFGFPELRHAARRCGIREVDGTQEEKTSFWKQAVHCSLRIAGLLHDMAYPQVMAYKVLNAAKPNAPFSPHRTIDDRSFDHLYDLFESSLCFHPFATSKIGGEALKSVIADGLESMHNFQGAMRVLRYAVEVDRVWKLCPFESFCIEWAALAILMHDFDKQFEEVKNLHPVKADGRSDSPKKAAHLWYSALAESSKDLGVAAAPIRPCFKRDPVSYILALADQLQDFGRLNYENSPESQSPDQATISARYPIEAVQITSNAGLGTLQFFESSRWKLSEYQRKKKVELAEKIFGTASSVGWLDHTEWVRSFGKPNYTVSP